MKTVDVLQRSTIRKLNTLAKPAWSADRQESRKGLVSIPLCGLSAAADAKKNKSPSEADVIFFTLI